MRLAIGNGSGWEFVNGRWADGPDGALVPVDGPREDAGAALQGYRFAFFRGLAAGGGPCAAGGGPCAAGDLSARFRFRQAAHSDVGLVFRAAGRSRFHVVHFPCCGQAHRAQHFWAACSRMDGDGYLRTVKLAMVPRVNSFAGTWHEASVRVTGGRLSVLVDGRGSFEADGLEPSSGAVGLLLFNGAEVRGVEVEASSGGGAAAWGAAGGEGWDEAAPSPNWFHPVPTREFGSWQKPHDLVRTPGGDLALSFAGNEGYGTVPRFHLVRSSDGGRTWSRPEFWWSKQEEWDGSHRALHVFPDGKLRCVTFGPRLSSITLEDTRDDGRSWCDARAARIGELPPRTKLNLGPQVFCNLRDGSMLLLAYGGRDEAEGGSSIYTWGATHCQAFASRSTDCGLSWSAPVNVDGARDPATGRPIDGNYDLTEVCAAQATDGKLVALVRPVYSPWMWETWSEDGGASWGPCVRGPFPGYATPNMLRTASGTLLVAHRLPGLTVNASRDGGRTWDAGTMIDSSIWAMGSMVEVAPDLVLYVHFDSFESLMRAQFFRVTAGGLEPAGRSPAELGTAGRRP